MISGNYKFLLENILLMREQVSEYLKREYINSEYIGVF
jgi:hypothetical protein